MRRAQEIELLQEVVLNSPLLRRKLLTNQSEEKEKKKKGIRKLLSGMVSSFRNVITGAIPTSTSKENSIPLVEFVTTRGKIKL